MALYGTKFQYKIDKKEVDNMQKEVRRIRVERPARLDDYAVLADRLVQRGHSVRRGEPLSVESLDAAQIAYDGQMDGFRLRAQAFPEFGITEVKIWRVRWEPRPLFPNR